MHILKTIRTLLVPLTLILLLSLVVSAALPPSSEIQWENTQSTSCDIFITDNIGTVSASINGKYGSTVEAQAYLYEILNGTTTLLYSGSTPEDNSLPFASFVYEFEIKSGATYYLVMNGVVSRNGVDENISDSDIEYIPA